MHGPRRCIPFIGSRRACPIASIHEATELGTSVVNARTWDDVSQVRRVGRGRARHRAPWANAGAGGSTTALTPWLWARFRPRRDGPERYGIGLAGGAARCRSGKADRGYACGPHVVGPFGSRVAGKPDAAHGMKSRCPGAGRTGAEGVRSPRSQGPSRTFAGGWWVLVQCRRPWRAKGRLQPQAPWRDGEGGRFAGPPSGRSRRRPTASDRENGGAEQGGGGSAPPA